MRRLAVSAGERTQLGHGVVDVVTAHTAAGVAGLGHGHCRIPDGDEQRCGAKPQLSHAVVLWLVVLLHGTACLRPL